MREHCIWNTIYAWHLMCPSYGCNHVRKTEIRSVWWGRHLCWIGLHITWSFGRSILVLWRDRDISRTLNLRTRLDPSLTQVTTWLEKRSHTNIRDSCHLWWWQVTEVPQCCRAKGHEFRDEAPVIRMLNTASLTTVGTNIGVMIIGFIWTLQHIPIPRGGLLYTGADFYTQGWTPCQGWTGVDLYTQGGLLYLLDMSACSCCRDVLYLIRC